MEGKGHFCAYLIARTHKTPQRRGRPPLLTSAQEGEKHIDLDVKEWWGHGDYSWKEP